MVVPTCRLLFVFVVLFVSLGSSATVQKTLEISHEVVSVTNFQSGEVETRLGSFVNSTLPGPTIRCGAGDTLEITIVNHMSTSGLTMHFHGQHMKDTFFYDGVHGVTQCDVSPGQSFTHRFTAWPPGTYIYHSHMPFQFGDGIFGPMIVDNPSDPFLDMYEDEFIIGVSDWLPAYSDHVFEFISQNHFSAVSYLNSFINGKTSEDPSIFQVSTGSSYRLRFYHIGAEYSHRIYLANHKMTVIAVDGANVKPTTVDFINLLTGMRVDVLVTMDQPDGVYEFRARAYDFRFSPIDGYVSALFQYGDSSLDTVVSADAVMDDQFDSDEYTLLDDYALEPYEDDTYESVPTKDFDNIIYYTATGANILNSDQFLFTESWNYNFSIPPIVPYVFSKGSYGLGTEKILELDLDPSATASLFPSNRYFKHNEVVDIVFQAGDNLAVHPNHLHGQYFWVLGTGEGAFNELTDIETLNFENPTQRDTLAVWPGTWTAIRFKASNRGAWLMHCHNEIHANFGMSTVFLVDPDNWPSLPSGFPVCGDFGSAGTHLSVSVLMVIVPLFLWSI